MRKGLGLFLTISLGMVFVLEAPRLGRALSQIEVFRVAEVAVEGAEYLTPDEILAAAAIPVGASVWDDLEPLAARLREHPLVREAKIRRRLPGKLVVEVDEREPVALVPNPTLTPVDREARFLPLSAAGRRLDLPLLQPRFEADGDTRELTPAQLGQLTSELSRLAELDPALHASVSEVGLDSWGHVLLHFDQPRVTLRYRAPLVPGRLNEGLRVLTDALEREPDKRLVSVDLRFADQVVVRFLDTPR